MLFWLSGSRLIKKASAQCRGVDAFQSAGGRDGEEKKNLPVVGYEIIKP